MKKIILSLLAVAGIFASCSNDDIEVNTYGDLTYSISTQSVYDDFGVSEQFKSDFLNESGDYNIGLWTFFYDEDGNLALADSLAVKTFGQIERHFSNLPTGQYTAITIEMLVKESEDNQSESFTIVGQDKLATLELYQKDFVAAWYSVVGVSTNIVNVNKGSNSELNVKPQGIGAYVDWYAYNFDYTDYALVGFYTKDQPVGRYLSPNYSGDERFHYDKYLDSNVYTSRNYRYPASGLIDNKYFSSAYLLEEGTVRCIFGALKENSSGKLEKDIYQAPTDDIYFEMKDGKTYYGCFCYVGGSSLWRENLKANIFNSYEELKSWYSQLSFMLNDYADPYLVWGAPSSTVETYMKNSGMKFVEDGFDSDNTLYYSYWINYSNTVSYEYRFETSKTNLNSLLMVYSKSKYKKTEVLDELKTKFVYDGYNETFGGDFLYSEDSSTMLLVVENDEDFRVLYIGGLSSSAAPRSKSYVGSIFNEAKSLFKSNKK